MFFAVSCDSMLALMFHPLLQMHLFSNTCNIIKLFAAHWCCDSQKLPSFEQILTDVSDFISRSGHLIESTVSFFIYSLIRYIDNDESILKLLGLGVFMNLNIVKIKDIPSTLTWV